MLGFSCGGVFGLLGGDGGAGGFDSGFTRKGGWITLHPHPEGGATGAVTVTVRVTSSASLPEVSVAENVSV